MRPSHAKKLKMGVDAKVCGGLEGMVFFFYHVPTRTTLVQDVLALLTPFLGMSQDDPEELIGSQEDVVSSR